MKRTYLQFFGKKLFRSILLWEIVSSLSKCRSGKTSLFEVANRRNRSRCSISDNLKITYLTGIYFPMYREAGSHMSTVHFNFLIWNIFNPIP